MIDIKDTTQRTRKVVQDVTLEVNGKEVVVEVTAWTDFGNDWEVDWKFLTGSSKLSEEDQDELDNFITVNY